jgi:hypothetical protein
MVQQMLGYNSRYVPYQVLEVKASGKFSGKGVCGEFSWLYNQDPNLNKCIRSQGGACCLSDTSIRARVWQWLEGGSTARAKSADGECCYS